MQLSAHPFFIDDAVGFVKKASNNELILER